MSDLLTYSIMYNSGSTTNTTTTTGMKHQQQPFSLPPLSPPTLRQLPPIQDQHIQQPQIVLPPIIPSNYTTSKPMPTMSVSGSGSTTPQRLTESNLTSHHHGLGLLTSAMMNIEQPPSLTSSSSCSSIASLSSPSSPEMSHAHHHSHSNSHHQKRRQRLGPSCDSCRLRKVKCNAEIIILSKDVKPNLVYGWFPHLNQQQMDNLLGGQLVNLIEDGGSYNLIISHDKLIKFKSCNSCKAKQLPCCFSKGFTKEDIMNHKKHSTTPISSNVQLATPTSTLASPVAITNTSYYSSPKKTTNNKIIKKKVLKLKPIQPITTTTFPKQEEVKIIEQLNLQQQKQGFSMQIQEQQPFQDQQNINSTSRKSSCVLCRKRKVKCVFNASLNRCEGCNKKNNTCVFDNQK